MLEPEGWKWAAERGWEGVWMVWRWGFLRLSICRSGEE
jgi:hypothetical protein